MTDIARGALLQMDVELNRMESELQQEESALHTELTRLMAVGLELEKKLKAVKASAAEAAAKGASDQALDGRLQAVAVPEVDSDAPFDSARDARETAVAVRKKTNVAVRAQVTKIKAQLTALSQQLSQDEKAAQRLVTQANAPKARAQPPPPPAPSEETLRPGAIEALPQRVRSPTRPPRSPPPELAAKRSDVTQAAPRYSPRVKMQASVDLSSDNNFFNGFSSNISDGGLFVATVNLLPIGTEIDLTFSLPTGEKVAAHGLVRWVREVNDNLPDAFPGLGIQFTRLDDSAQAAIDQFVAEREPLFYSE
jgi:uncharacterized protein (TIGR02266 family)